MRSRDMQEYDPNKFTVILLPVPLEKAQKFLEKDPQSFAMACSLSMKSQAENNQILEIGNFKELGLASESRYRRCKKILEDMGFLSLITTCRQHSVEGFSNKQETIQDTIQITKKHTKKTIVKLSYNHDLMFITKTQKQPNERPNERPYERPTPFFAQPGEFFAKKIVEKWKENSSHPFRYTLYIYKIKSILSFCPMFFQPQKSDQKVAPSAPPKADCSAKPKISKKKKRHLSFNPETGEIEMLDSALLERLGEAYSGQVNIVHELKRLAAWCVSKSVRANTNIDALFGRWIVKAYNDSLYRQANGYQNQKQPPKRPTEIKFDPALEDQRFKRKIPF